MLIKRLLNVQWCAVQTSSEKRHSDIQLLCTNGWLSNEAFELKVKTWFIKETFSLTKIAALNRMQLLQQQQRNNTLTATNRINSGSSTNLTGGLFNNSLEVAHEEGRLEIGQSFGSSSSNAMRT